jgi:RNA-directed DNA polymerase
MKPEAIHINHIKESYAAMSSKEDLLELLNYSKGIIYGEKAKPFELKQLNYYSYGNNNKYSAFNILKKSGAERTIHAPVSGLKAIQKCLNLILQTIYEPHKAATGFVPNKSIVDNASVHKGSIYVYNIDLKDFFPSIDQARVWGRLQKPPFNLNKDNNRMPLANIIAALSCYEMEVERKNKQTGEWEKAVKNVLPQGAPTSPTITNIICERLDIRLSGVAKRFGLRYSRYADDITFSSMHNVFQKDAEFLKEIQRIITDQNFIIKESKTRLQKQGYRQEVTGLLVNDKVNVQQRYIKQLRMWLYLWEKYGYEKATTYFSQQYISDKGHTKKLPPVMQNVISGKLEYLKMVKGADNTLYKKLRYRFERLLSKNNQFDEILNTWEKEGIEKAMELYYQPKIKTQSDEIISNVKTGISLQDDNNTGIIETRPVVLSKEVGEVLIVSLNRSKEIENCLHVDVLFGPNKTYGGRSVAYDKHKDLKVGKAQYTHVKFSGVNRFNPNKPNENMTFKNINKASTENNYVNSDGLLINDLNRFQLNDNSLKSYVRSQDINEITIEGNLVKLFIGNKEVKLQLTVAKNRLSNLPAVFNLVDEEELSKWVIFNHPSNKKTYLAYIGDLEFKEI